MPLFAVEHEDGRVFEVEAASAEAAGEEVARTRNLRRAALRVMPVPRHERELSMPLFWVVLVLVTLYVVYAIATWGEPA